MLDSIYKLPLGVIGIVIVVSGLIWSKIELEFSSNPKALKKWKLFNCILALISLSAILYMTFLTRSGGGSDLRLTPFYSFELAKSNPEMYRTMMMNVVLFLPWGLSLGVILPKKIPIAAVVLITALSGALLSLGIEFLQYWFELGVCEIDDVICNTFGAFMGSLSIFWKKIILWIRNQKFYDVRIEKYLDITFSITWSCWCLLAVVESPEYFFKYLGYSSIPLHIIGGFAPFMAVLTTEGEKSTINYMAQRFKHHTNDFIKYLLIFVIAEIALFGLSSMCLNTQLQLWHIPIVLLQAIFIYGGNEELGWRGYMQPILEESMPFPVATMVTGIIWSLWHIPLWFVYGSSQQNMSFLLFMILGIILSFWFAAFYKKTESVFGCSILHGLTNTLLSMFIIKINLILIIGLIALTSFSVYLYYKRTDTKKIIPE